MQYQYKLSLNTLCLSIIVTSRSRADHILWQISAEDLLIPYSLSLLYNSSLITSYLSNLPAEKKWTCTKRVGSHSRVTTTQTNTIVSLWIYARPHRRGQADNQTRTRWLRRHNTDKTQSQRERGRKQSCLLCFVPPLHWGVTFWRGSPRRGRGQRSKDEKDKSGGGRAML